MGHLLLPPPIAKTKPILLLTLSSLLSPTSETRSTPRPTPPINSRSVVAAIIPRAQTSSTYNITISDSHTYFITNSANHSLALTHNACAFRDGDITLARGGRRTTVGYYDNHEYASFMGGPAYHIDADLAGPRTMQIYANAIDHALRENLLNPKSADALFQIDISLNHVTFAGFRDLWGPSIREYNAAALNRYGNLSIPSPPTFHDQTWILRVQNNLGFMNPESAASCAGSYRITPNHGPYATLPNTPGHIITTYLFSLFH